MPLWIGTTRYWKSEIFFGELIQPNFNIIVWYHKIIINI